MAMHSVWVHGNAARIQWAAAPAAVQVRGARADGSMGSVPWSDVVGLPQPSGMIFRGHDRAHGAFGAQIKPQPSVYFHFAIPTPVVVAGVRAKLVKVFVLWKADPSALLQEIYAFDGQNDLKLAQPPKPVPGVALQGKIDDIVDNVTQFALATPHEMMFGLGITIGFGFAADTDVTFTAAGADFDI